MIYIYCRLSTVAVKHRTKFHANRTPRLNIITTFWNLRWRPRLPSWIFKNLISEQWVSLGCRLSITVPNLVQKNVDRRRNYGPKSKFKMAAVHSDIENLWTRISQIWVKCSWQTIILTRSTDPNQTWQEETTYKGNPHGRKIWAPIA